MINFDGVDFNGRSKAIHKLKSQYLHAIENQAAESAFPALIERVREDVENFSGNLVGILEK